MEDSDDEHVPVMRPAPTKKRKVLEEPPKPRKPPPSLALNQAIQITQSPIGPSRPSLALNQAIQITQSPIGPSPPSLALNQAIQITRPPTDPSAPPPSFLPIQITQTPAPKLKPDPMKYYTLPFDGPSYGIVLCSCRGRIVVHRQTVPKDLPEIGDVLLQINGSRLKRNVPFPDVLLMLKDAMSSVPVNLHFVRDAGFTSFFRKSIQPKLKIVRG